MSGFINEFGYYPICIALLLLWACLTEAIAHWEPSVLWKDAVHLAMYKNPGWSALTVIMVPVSFVLFFIWILPDAEQLELEHKIREREIEEKERRERFKVSLAELEREREKREREEKKE